MASRPLQKRPKVVNTKILFEDIYDLSGEGIKGMNIF